MNETRRKEFGATLVELAIALAVLGIGMVAVFSAGRLSVATSTDPMESKQAFALAESLLDEISSKSYAKPAGGFSGTPSSSNRQLFDTVTDYSGLTFSPLTTLDGGALPASVQGYSASVNVGSAMIGTSPNDVPAHRITVTVTSPSGKGFSLVGYRLDYEN